MKEEAGPKPDAQIERAYEIALSRKPTPAEKQHALEFYRNNADALVDFCQTVFNLNEFAYLP